VVVTFDPERARAFSKELTDRVEERLFGVGDALRLVLVGIFTGNHVLIDDVPGVGKTTLVRIVSSLLGLRFQRVQFTPDLMPSDITGTSILDLRTNGFEFREGPLFTQILLADEINRATPKTQAALLEAMQERQVTVDGQTSAPPAVLRPRDAEPDRARGHVPVARGAARPVPPARPRRVPE
jgi:MoxR-like ATPase